MKALKGKIKGVKRIEDSTFANCIQIENIKIPESVEYIGEAVFSNCKSLTGISIPDSITYINNSTSVRRELYEGEDEGCF